jgi:hypothetical protein
MLSVNLLRSGGRSAGRAVRSLTAAARQRVTQNVQNQSQVQNQAPIRGFASKTAAAAPAGAAPAEPAKDSGKDITGIGALLAASSAGDVQKISSLLSKTMTAAARST